MTHATMDVTRLLRAVQRQLRTDVEQLAEETLPSSSCADRNTAPAAGDLCHVDFEQMRIKLALRTLASRYELLNRLEKALDTPQEMNCGATELVSRRSTA